MDFFIRRGQDFRESFNFKNADGLPISVRSGEYKLILRRGTYAKEFTIGGGLSRFSTHIDWVIPAEMSRDFPYNTLYYTLYMNDLELARGVLKVQ